MSKLTIICVLLTSLCKGQYFIAGSQAGYYADINPDTLIHRPQGNLVTSSYTLDVNRDSVADLTVKHRFGIAPGGVWNECELSRNTSKVSFFLERIDSTYIICSPTYSFYRTINVLKYYSLNDTIKPGPIMDSVAYFYSSGMSCAAPYDASDWIGIGDKFIGFSYNNGTGIDYGWIRAKVDSGNQVIFKDFCINYSCSVFPPLTVTSSSSLICSSDNVILSVNGAATYTWSTGNNGNSVTVVPDSTTIYSVSGTTANGCVLNSVITQSVDACIGINEYTKDGFKTYPNPATEYLNISYKEIKPGNVEITNCLGQSVLKTEFRERVDVSDFASGIYTLKIVGDNKFYYAKFVKE